MHNLQCIKLTIVFACIFQQRASRLGSELKVLKVALCLLTEKFLYLKTESQLGACTGSFKDLGH